MSPSGAAAYPPEALFAAAAVIDRALMGLPCYGERHADSDVELARAALDAALPFLAAGTPEISDEEFEAAKADVIARFGSIPPTLQDVIDKGGRFGRPVERAGGDGLVTVSREDLAALLRGCSFTNVAAAYDRLAAAAGMP